MGEEEPGAATTRGPRRRLPPEDRKQALITVALELFNAKPYDQVSVDDIAAAADMSRPLLYHYYGGKHGVFLAALRHAADDLLDAIRDAAVDSPEAWLSAGLRAYLDRIDANPIAFTTLLCYGGGPAGDEGETIIGQVREAILDRVMAALRPATEPPLLRSILRGWSGMVEVITRQWQETGEPSRADLERIIPEMFDAALQTAARNDPAVREALRSSSWRPPSLTS